jgi:hypothetical protein
MAAYDATLLRGVVSRHYQLVMAAAVALQLIGCASVSSLASAVQPTIHAPAAAVACITPGVQL